MQPGVAAIKTADAFLKAAISAAVRLAEQPDTRIGKLRITRFSIRAAIIYSPQILIFKQTVMDRPIWVYKVRVSGIHRKTLVRRIAKTCWPDGQNLPDSDLRRFQKIDKIIRLFAQRADAIRRGQ